MSFTLSFCPIVSIKGRLIILVLRGIENKKKKKKVFLQTPNLATKRVYPSKKRNQSKEEAKSLEA